MHDCQIPLSMLFLAICAHLPADLAGQQPIAWSPRDRASLEGNSYSHYPLGKHNARVQTLHDDMAGGLIVSGHAYRRDAIGKRGQVAAFQSDLQVTLSMSPNPAAQASPAFANNVGPTPVVVVPRTTMSFPATSRPALDPASSWELMIPYTVPFLIAPNGGTLCVDVEVFGNRNFAGSNANISIYLDAQQQFLNGRNVQPGFRMGTGCPAPGRTDPCYANLDLWRFANGTTEMDISIRDGVADTGSGSSRAFLTMGNRMTGTPWITRQDCAFWSSSEIWFALPGTMTATGSYDGTVLSLPSLPPGYRIWCQAGSIDLTNTDMSFSDAITLITPPLAQLPVPAIRIANGNHHASATGAVSTSVPVMAFF